MKRYEKYQDNDGDIIFHETPNGEWSKFDDIPLVSRRYADGAECNVCGYYDNSMEKCDKWYIYPKRDFFCSDFISAKEGEDEQAVIESSSD